MSHEVIKSGPGKGAYKEHKPDKKVVPKTEKGGPMYKANRKSSHETGYRKKEYSNMGAITVKSGPR
mgnify:FL=1|jgi:hypothetical protein|tara:strand:- start:11 stop:208 length:198 start_codon:yes stop_codon:yes gene_type:complete